MSLIFKFLINSNLRMLKKIGYSLCLLYCIIFIWLIWYVIVIDHVDFKLTLVNGIMYAMWFIAQFIAFGLAEKFPLTIKYAKRFLATKLRERNISADQLLYDDYENKANWYKYYHVKLKQVSSIEGWIYLNLALIYGFLIFIYFLSPTSY